MSADKANGRPTHLFRVLTIQRQHPDEYRAIRRHRWRRVSQNAQEAQIALYLRVAEEQRIGLLPGDSWIFEIDVRLEKQVKVAVIMH
jgi:hypothetical protein